MAVSLQQTLVIPLVPVLPEAFDTSPDTASWLLTVTLLSGAVATPVLTRLADLYGKRRMALVAMSVMTLGSLVLAVTTSLVAAMVGRGLQGLAAAIIPIGISILRDELPPHRVGFGIALMSTTLGIGGALGLPLSGILYETSGWSSLFWVTGSFTALILVAVAIGVPESRTRARGSFDLVGALVLSFALVTLMLFVSKGGSWGWASPVTLGLLVASVVTFAAWVPSQLRRETPMVDLRTFSRRPMLLTNVASVLLTVGMMANNLLTIPFVEAPEATGHGFGISVMGAGLVMIPSGLAMVVFAPVSGRMLNRVGGRGTLLVGALVMAVSYLTRPLLAADVTQVVVATTLCGIGAAMSFAAMPVLVMASARPDETASANGINSLMRSIGMAGASAGIAALLAGLTTTHVVDGVATTHASTSAFTVGFLTCGVLSLVAAVTAAFIPPAAASRRGTTTLGRGIGERQRVVGDSAA